MLCAPADAQTWCVRGGCFGNQVIVLCCERVPRAALAAMAPPSPAPASFFSAGGEGRGQHSVHDLNRWDEVRNVGRFDASRPPLRTCRRAASQANASSQMASLLMGTHEPGELTGAFVPKVGQHLTLPEGGADVLTGGLSALAKDQRHKLVLGTRTQWHQAFELEIPDVAMGTSAAELLEERFGVAVAALRDRVSSDSYRAYRMPLRGYPPGKSFAAVQGDVDKYDGRSAIERTLCAMREACAAVVGD